MSMYLDVIDAKNPTEQGPDYHNLNSTLSDVLAVQKSGIGLKLSLSTKKRHSTSG